MSPAMTLMALVVVNLSCTLEMEIERSSSGCFG
ncbi:hypothetical protein L195_g063752, partial [Trifolium pratense]